MQDQSNRRLYALKKICCPMGGQTSVSDAMHEVDMYKLFQSDYIIKVLVSKFKKRSKLKLFNQKKLGYKCFDR